MVAKGLGEEWLQTDSFFWVWYQRSGLDGDRIVLCALNTIKKMKRVFSDLIFKGESDKVVAEEPYGIEQVCFA